MKLSVKAARGKHVPFEERDVRAAIGSFLFRSDDSAERSALSRLYCHLLRNPGYLNAAADLEAMLDAVGAAKVVPNTRVAFASPTIASEAGPGLGGKSVRRTRPLPGDSG